MAELPKDEHRVQIGLRNMAVMAFGLDDAASFGRCHRRAAGAAASTAQAVARAHPGSARVAGKPLCARGRGALNSNGEAGHYDTKVPLQAGEQPQRRLKLYDDAFKNDEFLVEVVAREIGHGLSYQPSEHGGQAIAVSAAFQAAANADSPQAITAAGDKNWHEKYAEAYGFFIAEPGTLKLLRPHVYTFFEKQQGGLIDL